MFFEVIIDLLWIIIIYFVSYKVWHIFLSQHSNILNELFNIDVRYYNYNRESSTSSQHEILYTLASTTMSCCMIISPIIHSTMYLLFYNMIDIIQVNKILITITISKLLWFFDIRNRKCTVRPEQTFLLLQISFIIINYNNTSTILPVFFQLIDELSNIEDVVITMSRHYTTLFGNESSLSTSITQAIVIIKTKKVLLKRVHMVSLSFILLLSLLYSNMKTSGEVIFFYYAVLRILQVNYNQVS